MKTLLIYIAVLLGGILFYSPSVNAAGFEAGRIIDDAIFTNKSSMSANEIQIFLNSKVSTCDTWGQQPSEFGGGTRRQWGEARGLNPPYTCLKDYSESSRSAAQIIYDISQEFSINPQVLIVLLQKEQGLITDTWPTSTQYKTATGYGCPDTAPCDSQYYGLTNQLTWAAKMFRAILNNSPTWYTPYILGNNYIQYNPTASCGGSNVNIVNRSTQALYNYTPYQPNQGALAAGWGQASCGAYGNRNFYLYFTSWFGQTTTATSWQTVGQGVYTDSSKRQPVSTSDFSSGSRYYLTVALKNTGNVTWTKNGPNPVNLGTTSTQDRASAFCDPSWMNASPGCNRVASLHEYTVAPGQIGSFEFWITAPSTGSYNEFFAPVMEGVEWMGMGSISFPAVVSPPYYTSAITGQYAYKDSSKQATTDIRNLIPGNKYYLGITLKNTGNVTWTKNGPNPVNLGTTSTQDRASAFCDPSWMNASPGCNRVASLHEYTVAPGQIGSFEFWITAPSTGSYNEFFAPVMEGKSWIESGTTQFRMGVSPYTWEQGKQTTFSNSSKQTKVSLSDLKPSTRYYIASEIKNTGGAVWKKNGSNPTVLGTSMERDRVSAVCDATWLACNRPALIHEYSISPGQTGSYEFWFTTPASPGVYTEKFTPLTEGLNWMGVNTIDLNFTVK